MAELADALDSGSSEGSLMQVQVLLSAFHNIACRDKRFIRSAYFYFVKKTPSSIFQILPDDGALLRYSFNFSL